MALHKTLVLDANMQESTLSSRGYEDKKKGNRRMDPRLLMSRMTEGEKARMTEGGGEDDRRGIGMKIANDNPKLSFLLPFRHFCSPSVIPAKAGIQA